LESDPEFASTYNVPLVFGGATVRVVDALALAAFESVTLTVKLDEPAAQGVPLMTPLAASKVRPPGKAPHDILKLYGLTPPDTEIAPV
jgi:hypothetical protein